MKNRAATLGLLLISTVIHTKANGESATRILQPRNYNSTQIRTGTPVPQSSTEAAGGIVRQQKPVRRVASVGEKTYGNIKTRRGGNYLNPDRATDLRLSLFGGLSNLGSGNETIQGFRDEQKLGSNYLAGIGADVRLQRYFGAELDAYYGIAPTQTIIFDEEETQKKKIQHLGGMFNLKVQYPAYLGSVRVVPKLGVGYGMLTLKQSTESQIFQETVEASESIKGVYGTIGFDVEPISWMVIMADYAKSVTGSGSFSVKSNAATADVALNEAQFSRLRFGILFRVYPNVMIGGNYIRRTMAFTTDESDSAGVAGDSASLLDISSSEALSQIAGTLLFQF